MKYSIHEVIILQSYPNTITGGSEHLVGKLDQSNYYAGFIQPQQVVQLLSI